MTRTMKAAVVHHFGRPLAIEEVPVPEPKRTRFSSVLPRRGSAIPISTQRRAIGPSSRTRPSYPDTKAWGR